MVAAAVLAVLTVVRLMVAAFVPLAPDEAYYWIWSRALAPGFPDHPPMVALWIRAGTMLAGQTALGVRLLGPLSVALATWMLADAADRLLPGRRAGLVATSLLNATLLVGVGTVIMTPDTPLLFFWVAALWAMARLMDGGRGAWWLAVGAFAGLAMASKYSAAFLWLGIALWLLIVPQARAWLRRWQPWAGVGLGLLLFLPVLLWNADHGWVSFVRQGGRVGDWQPARAAGFLLELIGGQIGLATPGVWLLSVAGIVEAVRLTWRTRDPAWTLLAALSLPAILVFVQHATGDRVQGNWPAIIYPAAVVAASGLRGQVWRRLRWPSVGLGLAITVLVYLHAAIGIVPAPSRLDPVAIRLDGWTGLARQVEDVAKRVGADRVVTDQYALAAELAWTMPNLQVLADEPRWRLFRLPHASDAAPALLVRDSGRSDPPDLAQWAGAVREGDVARKGGGKVLQKFALFRVDAVPRTAVLLPGR